MFFYISLQRNPSLSYMAVRDLQALNTMRVCSHSYWLVIFCTTNCSPVLARKRWQTFENSRKKTQYLMNTLYINKHYFSNFSFTINNIWTQVVHLKSIVFCVNDYGLSQKKNVDNLLLMNSSIKYNRQYSHSKRIFESEESIINICK